MNSITCLKFTMTFTVT